VVAFSSFSDQQKCTDKTAQSTTAEADACTDSTVVYSTATNSKLFEDCWS